MNPNPFDRRVSTESTPCIPERRVSQQIERLCGERASNDEHGAHRCYLRLAHDGPHHCACEYEWTVPAAGSQGIV